MERRKPTAPLSFARHVEHQNQRQCSSRDERSWIEFEQRGIKFYCTDGAKNLRRGRSGKRVSPTAIRNLALRAIQNLGDPDPSSTKFALRLQEGEGLPDSGNANSKVFEKRIPTPLVPARQQLIPISEKFRITQHKT